MTTPEVLPAARELPSTIDRQRFEQLEAGALPTPTDLLQIAIRKDADVDALGKLMAMQTAWLAQQAERDFNVAVAQWKREAAPAVYKTTVVTDGPLKGKKHASLGDLARVCTDSMSEYGLSYRWEVDQQHAKKEITITCVLLHAGGHSTRVSMTGNYDTGPGRNAIQAVASASTYLRRYTLEMACGIATEAFPDDDARGAGAAQGERPQQRETKPREQPKPASKPAPSGDDAPTEKQLSRIESLAGDDALDDASRAYLQTILDGKRKPSRKQATKIILGAKAKAAQKLFDNPKATADDYVPPADRSPEPPADEAQQTLEEAGLGEDESQADDEQFCPECGAGPLPWNEERRCMECGAVTGPREPGMEG